MAVLHLHACCRFLAVLIAQGGPDRLSRHDMAVAVAKQWGFDSKAVLSAHSADVKR